MSQEPNTENIAEVGEALEAGESTPTPDVSHLLSIDSTKLDAEIQRLQRENKEFANAFNRAVGNKAARQYKPRIQELESLLSLNQRELKRLEYSQLPSTEVDSRFRSDPEFAREYADVVHSTPAQINQMTEQLRVRSLVTETITDAIEDGLPEELANSLLEGIASGKYNDRGSINSQLYAFQRDVQKAITENIRTPQQPTPKAQAEPETAPPPPASPGPELSRGAAGTTTRGPRTLEDYERKLATGDLSDDEWARYSQLRYQKGLR